MSDNSRSEEGKSPDLYLHSIPVGGEEPVHVAISSCWCYPLQDTDSPKLYKHNAKDCREVKERQGITNRQSFWILIWGVK